MPLPRRPVLALVPTCLAALIAGCGEKRTAVHPVRGSVFVNGQPAAKALVVFHPLGDADPRAPRPTAEVGADGSFTLSTYSAGDGAPAGEYKVTVSWPEGAAGIGGDADTGPDQLGDRFSAPERTPLKATVRDGSNDLPAYKLDK